MRKTLLLILLLAFGRAAGWAQTEPPETYRVRRAELAAKVPGIVVLFGRMEVGEELYGFRQPPDFFYLTGIEDPGAVVMLVPARQAEGAGAMSTPAQPAPAPAREVLFLPARNAARERFMGKRLAPDDADAKERTGFQTVMPLAALEGELRAALASFSAIYTVSPPGSGPDDLDFERDRTAKLRLLAPFAEIRDIRPVIGRMRQKKSPREIALLEKAAQASADAHLAAMKGLRPGMFEYELSALMVYTFSREGCERPAYAPIVGSGPNATVLHYSAGRRRMEAGELVVVDVAAECDRYASDITRTFPISGKFTPRQRELYEVVLGAQQAAIAAIKPGAIIGGSAAPDVASLTKIARDYINTHGKDLKGEPLGKYFVHGLSHGVGLDVHDPTEVMRPLEAGMVITIEPGVYIPEEKIGIRVEDTVLVTENGARVLTGSLPKDAAAIERLMAARPPR